MVVAGDGKDAAEFFNKHGIAVFVLKYRLFRQENSLYKIENTLEDRRKAARVVRQKAAEYNIDTIKLV